MNGVLMLSVEDMTAVLIRKKLSVAYGSATATAALYRSVVRMAITASMMQ